MSIEETNHTYPQFAATSFRASLDVVRSKYPDLSVVHQFGRNESVGTTLVPIALNGIYQTPTGLTSLEIVSGSADDTAAGSGAQKVFVQGLSTDWELTSEIVTMNGTTAVALANQYFRIFSAYVYESGTYANTATPSHAGIITIRTAGAGASWLVINGISVFAKGQSQCGVYTVPTGYTAYISTVDIYVETTKPATIFLFKREGADVASAPYTAMRIVKEWNGIDGPSSSRDSVPLGPFPEKTDFGFASVVAANDARVSVDFEILLVKN